MPKFVEPQLAKLVEQPPGGSGWAHEVKFDGYRLQLRIEKGKATLRTRKGLDWTAKFTAIAQQARSLPDGMIDGEAVALDKRGVPDFGALQAALSEGKSDALVFFAFDLLFADGEDLRGLPLSERKARLKDLLDGLKDKHQALRYVEHFETSGVAVLESASRMGFEGIISKELAAPYRSGRVGNWLKAKSRAGHEVVIGGWTSEAQESQFPAGRRPSRQEAGLCRQGRHRLWRSGDPQAAAQASGGRKQDQPVRRRRQSAPGTQHSLDTARAGGRDRVRRLDRRRQCAAGRFQGAARGQAGRRGRGGDTRQGGGGEDGQAGAQDNDAQDSDSQDCERQVARAGGRHGRDDLASRQALVAGREAAGHQARARPVLRGDRRLDDRPHKRSAVLAGAHARRDRRPDLLPASCHGGRFRSPGRGEGQRRQEALPADRQGRRAGGGGPESAPPSCIPGTASPASPSCRAGWCSISIPRPIWVSAT